VALEINAHPARLDLDEYLARRAKKWASRSASTLTPTLKPTRHVVYALPLPRRAWLTKKDVINLLVNEEAAGLAEEERIMQLFVRLMKSVCTLRKNSARRMKIIVNAPALHSEIRNESHRAASAAPISSDQFSFFSRVIALMRVRVHGADAIGCVSTYTSFTGAHAGVTCARPALCV